MNNEPVPGVFKINDKAEDVKEKSESKLKAVERPWMRIHATEAPSEKLTKEAEDKPTPSPESTSENNSQENPASENPESSTAAQDSPNITP